MGTLLAGLPLGLSSAALIMTLVLRVFGAYWRQGLRIRRAKKVLSKHEYRKFIRAEFGLDDGGG